jgi:hypothetical protein
VSSTKQKNGARIADDAPEFEKNVKRRTDAEKPSLTIVKSDLTEKKSEGKEGRMPAAQGAKKKEGKKTRLNRACQPISQPGAVGRSWRVADSGPSSDHDSSAHTLAAP